MSITNGKFNCYVCEFNSELNDELILKLIKDNVLPPDSSIGRDAISGIVSGFDFNRIVDTDNAKVGRYWYLSLRTASKKIPASLLNTLLIQECALYKDTNGVDAIPSKTKKQIKSDIVDKLISSMPVIYSDTPFVIDAEAKRIYIFVTSQVKVDELACVIVKSTKIQLNDLNVDGFNKTPYYQFLTWLLYKNERSSNGYMVNIDDYISIGLNGDIVLEYDNSNSDVEPRGNEITTLKKGAPTNSPELRTALLNEKNITMIPLNVSNGFTLSNNDQPSYECRCKLDGTLITLSAISLPDGEEMGCDNVFIERMELLEKLFDIIISAVKAFIKESTSCTDIEMNNILTGWMHTLNIDQPERTIVEVVKKVNSKELTPNIL